MTTFDPYNKWIILPAGTLFTAQSIYNDAMDWADEQEAMDHLPPMSATGYAPLGGGAYSDKIFILQDGWKIKPASGTFILTIVGTIITDDESTRITPPDNGSVQVVFQVSSQGIISIVGSGVTEEDKEDIANEVWLHSTALTLDERVKLIKQVESNRWKIENNKLTVYDDDDMTPLLTFNLKDKAGQPTETSPYERDPI